MCRLSSYDMQPPEFADLVVVAHKLICPVACGILVPQPGIEPGSSAVNGRVLTTGPPSSSHKGPDQDFRELNVRQLVLMWERPGGNLR